MKKKTAALLVIVFSIMICGGGLYGLIKYREQQKRKRIASVYGNLCQIYVETFNTYQFIAHQEEPKTASEEFAIRARVYRNASKEVRKLDLSDLPQDLTELMQTHAEDYARLGEVLNGVSSGHLTPAAIHEAANRTRETAKKISAYVNAAGCKVRVTVGGQDVPFTPPWPDK